MKLAESELIFNESGRIYHLNVSGEDIADIVILVGDPNRVDKFVKHFDKIEVERRKREFRTVTGTIGSKRITVIGTGIGTDNIDIVMNELDIAVNYDRETQTWKENRRRLTVIRAGTTGALQNEIRAGDLVVSSWAAGFDNLASYYEWDPDSEERAVRTAFISFAPHVPTPYFIKANQGLVEKFKNDNVFVGITATAPGFYGPQGRQAFAKIRYSLLPEVLHKFEYNGLRFTNFEMETSALLLLAQLMGWQATTVCVALAGRLAGTFTKDYSATIEKLVRYTIEVAIRL
ncbi:MAG: nucleoside phosphorylase [Chlorobi bacterium]|nr:nucleoside phosphorylase [Chlorobiota bacterium]